MRDRGDAYVRPLRGLHTLGAPTTAFAVAVRSGNREAEFDGRLEGEALREVISRTGLLAVARIAFRCGSALGQAEVELGWVVESATAAIAEREATSLAQAAEACASSLRTAVHPLAEVPALVLPERPRFASRVVSGRDRPQYFAGSKFSPVVELLGDPRTAGVVSVGYMPSSQRGPRSDLVCVADQPTELLASVAVLELKDPGDGVRLIHASGADVDDQIWARGPIAYDDDTLLPGSCFSDLFSVARRVSTLRRLAEAALAETPRSPSPSGEASVASP